MRVTIIFIFMCLSTYSSEAISQKTREDGKCGPGNLAPNGEEASCEAIPPFPTCCQKGGHCGWDCQGIATTSGSPGAAQPAQPAQPAPAQVFTSNGKYRSDGRCGSGFPLEDNSTPAECDPNSQFWCCSEHGFCGGTHEHCFCETCVNFRPVTEKNGVRSDRRCGKEFPQKDGSVSVCDGTSANHCCSTHGYCGPAPDHCECIGCVDYRGEKPKEVPLVSGRTRNDRRCGLSFPLPDGTLSECDGNSVNPCCSKWGFCGPGAEHCDCPECKDYRNSDQKGTDFVGLVRKDRRCGLEFPFPGGKEASQCDPNSANFCCSKWGFCGGDAEHCDCPECVNYKKA